MHVSCLGTLGQGHFRFGTVLPVLTYEDFCTLKAKVVLLGHFSVRVDGCSLLELEFVDSSGKLIL